MNETDVILTVMEAVEFHDANQCGLAMQHLARLDGTDEREYAARILTERLLDRPAGPVSAVELRSIVGAHQDDVCRTIVDLLLAVTREAHLIRFGREGLSVQLRTLAGLFHLALPTWVRAGAQS